MFKENLIWHGSQEEGFDLIRAIDRHCKDPLYKDGSQCQTTPMGAKLETCASHVMLSKDQRALDGFLFARRKADCFRVEEYGLSKNTLITTSILEKYENKHQPLAA